MAPVVRRSNNPVVDDEIILTGSFQRLANDDEACKAGRLLYGTLPALSTEEQAVLARAFVIH